MIKCKKCKRITKTKEITGSIKKYRIWMDSKKTEHKDIFKEDKVCFKCLKSYKEVKK